MALLEIEHLSRNFEGVLAVDDVSFGVDEGETVSVIGPNGAGKTTLFNLITGLDTPTHGKILFDGVQLVGLGTDEFAGYRIARTFQHGRVFGNLTVLENVLIGSHARRKATRSRAPFAGFFAELANGLVPFIGDAEEEQQRREAIGILGRFGDRLLPRVNEPAFRLSYANRRRLEIARALALKPRLLLLDEPTAGMNPNETGEMLELIRALKGSDAGKRHDLTILLIEHKLSLVMKLSQRVIVMDNGKKIAEGAPEAIRNNPRVIEAYLGHATRRTETSPYVEPESEPQAALTGPTAH